VLWYRRNQTKELRLLLFVLTLAPLLLLTAYPVLRVVDGLPIQAPTAGIFSWSSNDVLYGGPLVLAALVMVGYALRERRPSYALYGALLMNVTVTVLFVLAAAGASIDWVLAVRLAQLNSLAFAVYALPWLSTRRRWLPQLDQQRQKLADDLSELQVGLAIGFNALWIAPVALALILQPEPVNAIVFAAGGLLGWLSVATTLAGVIWLAKLRDRLFTAPLLAGALLAVSCLLGFSVAQTNGWLGLHVLTLCTTLSA